MMFSSTLTSPLAEAILRLPEMEVVWVLGFLPVAIQAATEVPELSSVKQKVA